MARPLQRTRLESGLRLDINELCRKGALTPGDETTAVIRWPGERGRATITADMRDNAGGRFHINGTFLMRWRTYRELHAKFERYEAKLDNRLLRAAARIADLAR